MKSRAGVVPNRPAANASATGVLPDSVNPSTSFSTNIVGDVVLIQTVLWSFGNAGGSFNHSRPSCCRNVSIGYAVLASGPFFAAKHTSFSASGLIGSLRRSMIDQPGSSCAGVAADGFPAELLSGRARDEGQPVLCRRDRVGFQPFDVSANRIPQRAIDDSGQCERPTA